MQAHAAKQQIVVFRLRSFARRHGALSTDRFLFTVLLAYSLGSHHSYIWAQTLSAIRTYRSLYDCNYG